MTGVRRRWRLAGPGALRFAAWWGSAALVVAGMAGVVLLALDGGRGPDVPQARPVVPGRSAADLAVAESRPREDSYYPEAGDPRVDSLHHDLTLEWDPATRRLTGLDVLTFRATRTTGSFQLDLDERLEVDSLTVDGAAADYVHSGKDLLVRHPVTAGRRYQVRIAYAGTPGPVPAPTARTDFSAVGWTVTADGEVWTMQEPFGAYTWYPVNDHPSDKALYDFTISAPAPLVGVANGRLVSRSEADGLTRTRWRLAEPAASYLVTVAIGEYEMTEDRTDSGVEVSYWTPTDDPTAVSDLRITVPAMAWIERRLGPYPFDTLGLVVTDSQSAMETQTMVTLGNNDYVRSAPVIVHELVHQWYGNQVTPTDWRDLWMNEGMTMYLQAVWQAERSGRDLDLLMDQWAGYEAELRATAGPPGRYDEKQFGSGVVYYGPALMWHELRARVGDRTFWALARAWPRARAHTNATRGEYLGWLERTTGEELSAFFRSWLMSRRTPPRG